MPGKDVEGHLLPRDALTGFSIAISASESADLGRLGLVEVHFKMALAEIARSVLVSGGKLGYGGHLDPEGYTAFLIQELQRYSRRDRPLRVYLSWPEHRKRSLQELEKQQNDLGLFGELICLDQTGQVIDPTSNRNDDPQPVIDDELRKQSLTALRECMARNTNGRVLIGGRRAGFLGHLPGVLEEALIGLQCGQPLYLAGGFGGVTFDIVKALEIDDGKWLPVKSDGAASDERLNNGLAQLATFTTRKEWIGLNNGLTREENCKLAATHRPGEIAALVSLGLGRRFSK